MKTIEQRVYDIVDREMMEHVPPHRPLRDCGCDSLDLLSIEMSLEKEFGIEFLPGVTDNRVNSEMSAYDIVLLVEYHYLNVNSGKQKPSEK